MGKILNQIENMIKTNMREILDQKENIKKKKKGKILSEKENMTKTNMKKILSQKENIKKAKTNMKKILN